VAFVVFILKSSPWRYSLSFHHKEKGVYAYKTVEENARKAKTRMIYAQFSGSAFIFALCGL
jgi:hypothetical protein